MTKHEFVLPTLILGPADVNRALLELQKLDDNLRQAAILQAPSSDSVRTLPLPSVSRPIKNLIEVNGSDLSQDDDREHLIAFMQSLQQHAPVLHVSFASEPSAAFTAHIAEWLRKNISKYTLIQIGLQPSIAAGCIVRTPSKVFDLSLRRHLQQKRSLMQDLMRDHKPHDAVRASLSKVPQ